MLLQLVCSALTQEAVVDGETFVYEWKYASLAPFTATVEVAESSHNYAVFLYSRQQLQCVNMLIAVGVSELVNVTLFQFQTVPLTLQNSEITFRVDSKLGGLSLLGKVPQSAALNIASSTLTY